MKNPQKIKAKQKFLRAKRTRRTILSSSSLPRLSVFRSLKHFYAQIIDDKSGITLCAASDAEICKKKVVKPVEIAKMVGEKIAQKAKEKKISEVVFDRGAYQYHGRVEAMAEGARQGGLHF